MKRQESRKTKGERRLLRRKKQAPLENQRRQTNLSRLAPGDGPSPIRTALAVKDATTNETAKTQEPGAQEQKARRFWRYDAHAGILNCSNRSNQSVDDE